MVVWNQQHYIEEELQNELLFEYMYLFDLMFDENYLEDRQINDVLLIGGGAFHYPKYFLAHHKEILMLLKLTKFFMIFLINTSI